LPIALTSSSRLLEIKHEAFCTQFHIGRDRDGSYLPTCTDLYVRNLLFIGMAKSASYLDGSGAWLGNVVFLYENGKGIAYGKGTGVTEKRMQHGC
jgi:hypothetical protein